MPTPPSCVALPAAYPFPPLSSTPSLHVRTHPPLHMANTTWPPLFTRPPLGAPLPMRRPFLACAQRLLLWATDGVSVGGPWRSALVYILPEPWRNATRYFAYAVKIHPHLARRRPEAATAAAAKAAATAATAAATAAAAPAVAAPRVEAAVAEAKAAAEEEEDELVLTYVANAWRMADLFTSDAVSPLIYTPQVLRLSNVSALLGKLQ